MTIKIKKIYVKDNGSSKLFKIKDHPYYLSLANNNRTLYENFIKNNHLQLQKTSGTWDGYLNLYEQLKTNFDMNDSDIKIRKINNNYVCYHGRHRICILDHIHGDNTKLKIKHGKLVKLT